MKKIKYVLITTFLIGIVYFSALAGYSLYKPLNESIDLEAERQEAMLNTKNLRENIEKQANNIKIAKVTPSTKMKYEYYYKGDNITETFEDVPPYFLLDLTRAELENNFKDWNVKSFSEKEVVMQKVMEGESSQNYIIGEYEGYIAVYYEKEINGTKLKEITDTPISSLSAEEQEKIKNGIKIVGEDKLMEFISNYES
ncbi:MAG: hypothetical protein K2L15_01335 [Eubacteriales bacterium]|nr:hypothetical protein [Eubacteriales bacterium]